MSMCVLREEKVGKNNMCYVILRLFKYWPTISIKNGVPEPHMVVYAYNSSTQERLRQKDCEFKASMRYKARPCLGKKRITFVSILPCYTHRKTRNIITFFPQIAIPSMSSMLYVRLLLNNLMHLVIAFKK
jgi:hypothetical protein